MCEHEIIIPSTTTGRYLITSGLLVCWFARCSLLVDGFVGSRNKAKLHFVVFANVFARAKLEVAREVKDRMGTPI